MKTTKIRKSANGESCTARIPGFCNFNEETTVLAHRNGGGMAMKRPDWQGAYCCSGCHGFFDGGYTNSSFTSVEAKAMFSDAIFETQERLFEKELLVAA